MWVIYGHSLFDASCRPELTISDRFPAQTSEWESVNIKDLYFAGVLMHMRDYKKKQSGFIHGFRYNIQALHHILEHKYHHQELPCRLIDLTPKSLTEAIIKRVNISSALWRQTGFLYDLIVISDRNKKAQYFQDLPIGYIHDSELGQSNHYYTISLEFGYEVDQMPDPFAINRIRQDDVDNAAQSVLLHPIIRRFCDNTLICEHHIVERVVGIIARRD